MATQEIAIAGRTTGLINLGERTRWRAKHFGAWWELEIEITAMQYPVRFVDEMVDGIFAHMHHEHLFEAHGDSGTLMTDRFTFQAPLGILGRLAERMLLTKHLTNFLLVRNQHLKEIAEKELLVNGKLGIGGKNSVV